MLKIIVLENRCLKAVTWGDASLFSELSLPGNKTLETLVPVYWSESHRGLVFLKDELFRTFLHFIFFLLELLYDVLSYSWFSGEFLRWGRIERVVTH